MDTIVDRFLETLIAEGIKMPWLEEVTGIETKRWHNIKQRKVMRTEELEAVLRVWPEYSYWMTTGSELPEAGQISPMTKRAQRQLK